MHIFITAERCQMFFFYIAVSPFEGQDISAHQWFSWYYTYNTQGLSANLPHGKKVRHLLSVFEVMTTKPTEQPLQPLDHIFFSKLKKDERACRTYSFVISIVSCQYFNYVTPFNQSEMCINVKRFNLPVN